MEIYGVIPEAEAEMFLLREEWMVNLWIFACSSVLNLQKSKKS